MMNRRILMLSLSIIMVVVILTSTTYALFFEDYRLENEENFTTGILDIDIDNDSVLNLTNSSPLSIGDGMNTTPYNFTITNNGNVGYKFNLKIIPTTTSNVINSNYIRVMVNDGSPVTLGTLSNNVIKSDLILDPGESIDMTVRIWIDESMPTSEIGKSFSAKIVTEGEASGVSLDTSGANRPDLVEGLVPVIHNGSTWIKADSSNTNKTYQWYDYNNKQWANAVLVSSSYRDVTNYDTFDVGDEVPEDAILAYYVWIPRYKYKVWNIKKVIGIDSYNAGTNGIDVEFESGTNTTGTIRCNNYSFASPSSSSNSPNETCSGANGEYYTHPAFTFGDTELRGIWVGKFELSSTTPNAEYGGGNVNTLNVRIKPNVYSWRYSYISNFSSVIQKMSIKDNEYGLETNSDSHMMKNMEWGAVAYFTHSKYGRCTNGTCTEVGFNSYYSSGSIKTGCGPQYEGSTTTGSICNEYNSELGQLASTTGNIYGVYDMKGGSSEYVMGNMSSSAGSYIYNVGNGAYFFTYSADTAKYVDTYAYGESGGDQTAYNRARLGDATGEVVKSSNSIWYNDLVDFVSLDTPWFLRSMFTFTSNNGNRYNNISTRATLVSLT